MEEQGTVSLWLGNSTSREALDEAMKVDFSEDGDFLGSPFSVGFGIDYYDDAVREAEFFEQSSRDLRQLLRGASYEEVILPRFLDVGPPGEKPFNTVVLLYNHRHEGPATWQGDGVSLRFVGSARYQ